MAQMAVAGVTPGKGGQMFEDTVPVSADCTQRRDKEGANVSVIFVPLLWADSILEAVDAGIDLVIAITGAFPRDITK